MCGVLHTQANAQVALLLADKYGMARPIERYAQHVEHALLPSMALADSMRWLNVFCHACHAPEPAILHALMDKIAACLPHSGSLRDISGFLKDGPGVAGQAAASAATGATTGASTAAQGAAPAPPPLSFGLHPRTTALLTGLVLDVVRLGTTTSIGTRASAPTPLGGVQMPPGWEWPWS